MKYDGVKIIVAKSEAELKEQISEFKKTHNVIGEKVRSKGAVLFYLENGQVPILSDNQKSLNRLLKDAFETEKELEGKTECEEILSRFNELSKEISLLIPVVEAEIGRKLTEKEILEGFNENSFR